MSTLGVRQFALVDYEIAWHAMQNFTDQRDATVPDEIWLLEHPAVFTQGQAGKSEHILAPGNIPVVQVDRGGQVTYHGPGQLVVYFLIDVRRKGLGVRDLVSRIEQILVDLLAQYQVKAYAKPDAPGVYVEQGEHTSAKIASLGLRIRRGCSFHGLALNVDMDLQPFLRINPCGYVGMQMTQLADQTLQTVSMQQVQQQLIQLVMQHLEYSNYQPLAAEL